MALYSILTKELGLSIGPKQGPDGLKFARNVVEYVCGFTNAFKFQNDIRTTMKELNLGMSPKDFRMRLVQNSYMISNLKFAALNLCFLPLNHANLSYIQRDFKTTKNDMVLLKKCFEGRKWRGELRSFLAEWEIEKSDVTHSNYKRLLVQRDQVLKELGPRMSHYVYNKMRFLVNSENIELRDFKSELTCKAIQSFYMTVPTRRSHAHVRNRIGLSCDNHAINMIKSFTSNKRRRMDNAGTNDFGGYDFVMRTVSENQLIVKDGEVASYETTLNELNTDENQQLLDAIHFERLVTRMGKTTVRKRILHILSGKECQQFTKYLRFVKAIKDEEDCIDFIERNGFDSIVRRLSKFFNVDKERLARYLIHVGQQVRVGGKVCQN